MTESDEVPSKASLRPRVALLSIIGFWLFYFAIVTVRSALLDFGDQWDMLGRRLIVTVVSAGATLLLYLILHRIPRRSLGLSVAIAATLAVPAAILYSAVNWIVFRAVVVREQTDKAQHPTKIVVIAGPHTSTTVLPAPPAPPSAAADIPSTPPMPPIPPVGPGVSRRIMVQVGGDEAGAGHSMTPIQAIADNAANGYFFIAAWAALYLALCYAAEVRVAERRAAGFRAAAQAAELRALRYQVNPHFLFNTLNSLSTLVLTDKAAEAERMILNLATFFRTSLTGDPTEDMRLDEEIRLQRLYLDIEAVRFPDRLIVELDIAPTLAGACVPGMILQPLVENAVKYGVSRARRPVTIRIGAQDEGDIMRLSVTDDGDPLPGGSAGQEAGAHGTGVGLRNVRDRIAARFGDAGACRWGPQPGGGFAVTLTLPIVRREY